MFPLLREEHSKSYEHRDKLLNGSETHETKYLDRIAIELLDTERAYVNDLHSVIQVSQSVSVSVSQSVSVSVSSVGQQSDSQSVSQSVSQLIRLKQR